MNEAGWRRAVNRMFDPAGRVADMSPGVPQITHDTVSVEEKDAIIQYLAENFGPGSTPRDLTVYSPAPNGPASSVSTTERRQYAI